MRTTQSPVPRACIIPFGSSSLSDIQPIRSNAFTVPRLLGAVGSLAFITLDIAILLGLLRLLRSIFPGITKARKARTTPDLVFAANQHNKQIDSNR